MLDVIQSLENREITFEQAKELAAKIPMVKSDEHLFNSYLNKNVFIRTVTHHYTGKVFCVKDGFICLVDVAWIADDGRFTHAMGKGEFSEVEVYPDGLVVNISIGSIVDICLFMFDLPRKQK